MSDQEHDNELQQALAENGSFDADKAESIKKNLVADYGAKARWIERIMWGYLVACVFVCIYAWRAFERATSTKEYILYAVVFLIGFETTILMKLWAHVANTKISLLKEVKLLRLAQPNGTKLPKQCVRPGLPRWERKAWMLVLLLVGLILPNLFFLTTSTNKADLCSVSYVTLDANGGGTEITECGYHNQTLMPVMSFEIEGNMVDEYRWKDNEGRLLEYEVTSKNGRKHYSVELPKPVKPQYWVSYIQIRKSPSLAQKQEDGRWIYRAEHCNSGKMNTYEETVLLPEGAELLSLKTKGPMQQAYSYNFKQQVFISGQRTQNTPFKYAIEYQFPPDYILMTEKKE